MYQKLDPREHVLKRPGMYIGSVKQDVFDTYVYDGKSISQSSAKFSPAFVTIFDEVLNNAIDHSWRCASSGSHANPVKNIKVSVDGDSICVWNDGEGIPVQKHDETGLMVPELIFGNMLTSSNYDDTKERTVGGQNGVGAKSTNIFSESFTVETCDGSKKYVQTWTDNMLTVGKAKVTSAKRSPYTSITFKPDYSRFGMKNLDDVSRSIVLKRAADACAVTPPGVSVWIDGSKLPYKSFEKYVDLYIGSKSDVPRYYERVNDDWEAVVCASTDGSFKQVSFVNGICTTKGGKHVEHASAAIAKKVAEALSSKRGGSSVKPQHVKNSLWVFLRCTIPNPTFDSQTKDYLTTPVSGFRKKFDCSQAFIDKIAKGSVGEKAVSYSKAFDDSSLKKTDGKMRSTVSGIPKLEDAHWAGTAKSQQCTLILTEGDSAKTMAVSGLSVVGRDRYGVFPLKGKLLNTRDAGSAKIAANDEITAIKKIMGLETGKDYSSEESKKTIRYGSILVLADQDVDGYHIRGLLFNLFHSMWPSLFNTPGFLTSMLTPVVRVFCRNSTKNFYNVPDFEKYMDSKPSFTRVKYYKGLGTSTSSDAKEYFRDMKRVTYTHDEVELDRVVVRLEVSDDGRVGVDLLVTNQGPDDAMDMAFNKNRANDRKEWLRQYNNQVLDYTKTAVPFVDFVNKELRLFSLDDLGRSIPSVVDGLKVSQRKILYACKLRPKSAGELRVAQLAGYVSEKAAYHHGEASLQSTIIGLAQNFVGSNNIPLLEANGQFGSRLSNGKDAASARYIYTDLRRIASYMFPDRDEPVLKRTLDDDRNPVDPVHYAPLLPMVLVNGANGIGTGFSTNVPKFNPADLFGIYLDMLAGESPSCDIAPWYNGFTGDMLFHNGKWYSKGIFKKTSATTIEVHELPVGTWTDDYKTWLEEKGSEIPIKKFEAHHTESTVKFILHFDPAVQKTLLSETSDVLDLPTVYTSLKLVSDKGLSTNNMYLFDSSGSIRLYTSVHEIIRDHYEERLRVYEYRKRFELQELGDRIDVLSTKAKFIGDVVQERLVLNNAPDDTIDTHGEAEGWTRVNGSFDYLARMPMTSVTKKRYDAILKERDDAVETFNSLKNTDITEIYKEELLELKRVWLERQ